MTGNQPEPVGGHLLAIGDSIANGNVDSMVLVPARGFGQWLADALDMSYTRYAAGGYASDQVLAEMVPRIRAQYDIAVISVGTNDALRRRPADAVEADVAGILVTVQKHASKVAVLSVPTSTEIDAVIRRVAEEQSIPVVDASLLGRRLMTPDGVHPTAVGQLVLADRTAAALGFDVRPSELAVNGGQSPLPLSYSVGHRYRSAVHTRRRAVGALRRAVMRRA